MFFETEMLNVSDVSKHKLLDVSVVSKQEMWAHLDH